MRSYGNIFVILVILIGLSTVYGGEKEWKVVKGAKLVEEDTYGKTYWDNPIDRGTMLYLKPVYSNDFKDAITCVKLPGLEKITIDVPLERFFSANKKLLYDGALSSTLKNGKERKNYWIEDCFFYDSQNGEAALRVLNYYLLEKGNIQRTFLVHWNLKRNIITKAVLLMEKEHQRQKGEYEYSSISIDPIGYNEQKKLYYYQKTEEKIKVELDGKYSKYIHQGNDICSIYAFNTRSNKALAKLEFGSRDTRGVYNPDLNLYFLPAYSDLGHVDEKTHPKGFLIDFNNGKIRTIQTQRHVYWADIDPDRNVLYHVSSSSGKLWETDLETGEKKRELAVGDAGDDRYRKFGICDSSTLLYYLRSKVLVIDTGSFTVHSTVDLAKEFSEFSSSSPAYILPRGGGIIVEARNDHNKTTGYLYYLKQE
ncbi:MAG: hypothetical protein JW881_04650 [Spirochaetales bacterium]|nr:hypothetical protein [Spirochaetales bacterium]